MKKLGKTTMQLDKSVWHKMTPEMKAAHEEKFYKGPRRQRGRKEKVTSVSQDGSYKCPEKNRVARKIGARKRVRADRTTGRTSTRRSPPSSEDIDD